MKMRVYVSIAQGIAVLTMVLIAAKLFVNAGIPWLWVFSPVWIGFLASCVLAFALGCYLIPLALSESIKRTNLEKKDG